MITAAQRTSATRVLLVDPWPDQTESVSLLLQLAGAIVVSAKTAAEAVATLRAESFDLIISELALRGTNGFDFAETLRRECLIRGALFISYSGYCQETHFRQSRAAGFDWHLVKPAALADFEALISLTRRGNHVVFSPLNSKKGGADGIQL